MSAHQAALIMLAHILQGGMAQAEAMRALYTKGETNRHG